MGKKSIETNLKNQTIDQDQSKNIEIVDTWENRIKDASIFMGISYEKTESILSSFGIDKEPSGIEMLSDEEITPFGDLRKIFCEDNKIPVPKLRMAMRHLRGLKSGQKSNLISPEMMELKTKYGIDLKIENIESSELIKLYKPEKQDSPITRILMERFGNKPVVVFKPDSLDIDYEATINYISDIDVGYPEQDTVESCGVLVKIYEIGKIPNQNVEEDPLFPNQPLKRGRSIVNSVNWEKITKEVRQFCRLMIDMREFNPNDKFAVKDLIKLLHEEGGFEELKKLYPEVYLEFRERRKNENLPLLKLMLSDARKTNNPFGINQNRKY